MNRWIATASRSGYALKTCATYSESDWEPPASMMRADEFVEATRVYRGTHNATYPGEERMFVDEMTEWLAGRNTSDITVMLQREGDE